MERAFSIKPGRYHIPEIGYVDSIAMEVDDDKAFAIYRLPRRVFPWISLGPDAASYLKKQKLKAQEVAALIRNAQSTVEVELLASLSDTKTAAKARDAKLVTLTNHQYED